MAEGPAPGLLAQFASPEQLVAAARAARDRGWQGLDAYTPFPVDDLNPILALNDRRISWLGLAGATFGLVLAYAMQIATNIDYRLDIGGRPLLALQAFALIGFEFLVLFAVFFMVFAFFWLNRLPRYHHPLFGIDRFERATRDAFFLFIPTPDTQAQDEARALLTRLGAMTIDEVPG